MVNMIAEMSGLTSSGLGRKFPTQRITIPVSRRRKKDLQARARPELVSMSDSLEDYDETYLGYAG